ncbi:hypothetical protein MHU86_17230 [Fragilaria crotonensis]|nr:hypothetical protein MHU86_17230 [Fragilaria crotonensis]
MTGIIAQVSVLILILSSLWSVSSLVPPRAPHTPSMTSARRSFLASAVVVTTQLLAPVRAQAAVPAGFKRIRTQFIAALGDPKASSGNEANEWGLWKVDPGPRGVYLKNYDDIVKNNFAGPDGWKFDVNDWWVEEHGLIMPPPSFPVPVGRYVVTGGREATTVLTIVDGGSWTLDDSTLYDVTHLPCRSARYKPNAGGGSPRQANQSDFPVRPGAEMPPVAGCDKQDYAVLFVIGVEDLASSRDL